ncbi:MAG: tetratricopeptide repeat protein [Phycisphaerales bacterium]|nr:tetratricopeptide repeat protein [Planctomycetota bacterium]
MRRSCRAECTQTGARPGFIRFAAVLAIVFLAAVVFSFVWILRNPAAPVVLPDLAIGGAKPAPVAAPSRVSGADSAKVTAILDSVSNLLRVNQVGQAETILKAAIAEHAGDQRLYVAYAELLLSKPDLQGAYENYQKALATGERAARLEFQAGTVASMLGKNDLALEHYAAAQAAEPTNPEFVLFLGQVQMQLGKLDEARASLVRVTRLAPEDARAWGSLGEIALRENKLNVAEQQIAKARELQPRETVWRFMEARLRVRAGHPDKALELILPMSDTDKRSEAIARLLADAFSMQRRDADAAQALAAASDESPGNANLAFDAAVRADKAGLKELAKRMKDRAAALKHPDAGKLP